MDIRIENLTKSYGLQKAVDNISFEVKPGEIVGFLGPNGAGKTTTMKMITDYLRMDAGNVYIGGNSIKTTDMRRNVGYLPENNPLYEEMPVIDYLDFCGRLHGLSKAELPARIRDMVRVCGLDAEKHKKIGELSKGFRQRVGLAQSMIHDPEVLVLDEPTSGLDPNQRVEIRELIKGLGRQKTVILSTHILPEVEATCDRILIINQGRIVADGTVDMLRSQASGQEVIKLRIEDGATDDVHRGLLNIPSVKTADVIDPDGHFSIESAPGEHSARSIFRMCVDRNWTLTELTPIETKLEDIFRNLTMN